MNKKTSLIISFLITVLLTFNYFILRDQFIPKIQREIVFVSRIIDGDTLELEDGRILRLLNINTQEKNDFGSNESIAYLKEIENSQVEIEITGIDKYKRYLARIFAPNYINIELVRLGLATKYLVSSEELSDFLQAEKYAIENEAGLWEKSQGYGCLTASIEPDEETLILYNSCNPINLTGWIIRDESRKKFILEGTLDKELKIFSFEGQNTKNSYFLNSNTNIWNNDRDTIYLMDKDNKIALYKPYGYP